MRTLVYQVFPDRFAIGRGRSSEEQLARPEFRGFERAPRWDAPPRPTGRELFGGDLDGIAERLDHVAELGADCLYLTPIGDAPSSHRYDARSYATTDPRLGGDEAFDRLARATGARGLGLVLDAVFNHVGEGHPWFLEARRDRASEKRRWFTFDAQDRHLAWRGYGHLPELRLEEPSLRKVLLEGTESVVRSWIRRGATGWRIDCANDCGPDFCAQVRRAVREEGGIDGAIGEYMSWAAPWLERGAVDGVMNYWFRETVVSLLEGKIPPALARANLEQCARAYPREGLLRSWNLVGSHDTPRVRSVLHDRERVLLAYLLAFTFPGTPLVYYGDEVGLEGGEDPLNRGTMEWDRAKWDRATLERVKALASIRRERRALLTGDYLPIATSSDDAIAFARTTNEPRETVIVVANPTVRPISLKAFAARAELFDALPLRDVLGGAGAKMKAGSFTLGLDAFEGAILVPEPVEPGGYDFMKRAL